MPGFKLCVFLALLSSTTVVSLSQVQRPHLLESYGKLPLTFEANHGQTDAQVRFLSRSLGYTLFLTSDEAVLRLQSGRRGAEADPSRETAGPPLTTSSEPTSLVGQATHPEQESVLRMTLAGANEKAEVVGLDEMPGKSNYFIGTDPAKWHANVPNYAKVKYEDVYPGVDLVYYGNQQQLEYDFIVAPGANPKAIHLSFKGADSIHVSPEGDLVLRLNGADLRFHKPVVYQPEGAVRSATARHLLDGRYVLEDRERIAFEVTEYDRTKPLVIDPVLLYSTYLGGSGEDSAFSLAVDAFGFAYVTGTTRSSDFPNLDGIQGFSGGSCGALPCRDVFVTKFNPAGSALMYSTIIGGTNDDIAQYIALDTSGNAYITGSTLSSDFPTTPGAFQSTYGGAGVFKTGDAFVTKLNAAGSALVYSTYLGGSGDENAYTIALDSSGNAYLPGFTTSTNFPSTSGAYQKACPNSPCYSAFVAKLNSTGTGLVYSTFLGGSTGGNINSASGLAIDPAGNAYVGGITGNSNFPTTAGAFKTSCGTDKHCNGTTDGFVSKLNSTGSALIYSTFLGGAGFDNVNAVAVDSTGEVYAAGSTVSADFPVTAGAAQSKYGGGSGCTTYYCGDAFVSKLNAKGSALVYSTYLGGSKDDGAVGLVLDPANNAYVTGVTSSVNFPVANAVQSEYGGGSSDGFVTELNPSGTTLNYSTYLGGNEQDFSNKAAVDGSGNIYVAGGTLSTNFPVTAGVFQSQNAGSLDAFVAKIGPPPPTGNEADLAIASLLCDGTQNNPNPPTVSCTTTVVNLGPATAVGALIVEVAEGDNVTTSGNYCYSIQGFNGFYAQCGVPDLPVGSTFTYTLTFDTLPEFSGIFGIAMWAYSSNIAPYPIDKNSGAAATCNANVAGLLPCTLRAGDPVL